MSLQSGQHTGLDFGTDFRMLADKSEWDQLAQADAFFNGLADALKDQLASIELPAELDVCIALASMTDKKSSE